jgi:signal transduction histidine kinase
VAPQESSGFLGNRRRLVLNFRWLLTLWLGSTIIVQLERTHGVSVLSLYLFGLICLSQAAAWKLPIHYFENLGIFYTIFLFDLFLILLNLLATDQLKRDLVIVLFLSILIAGLTRRIGAAFLSSLVLCVVYVSLKSDTAEGFNFQRSDQLLNLPFLLIASIHSGLVAHEAEAEQKEAESKIRQLNAFHNSVLEQIPLGIGVVRDNVILWANEAFALLAAKPLETLLGQPIHVIFPPDDAFESGNAGHPLAAHSERLELTAKLRRPDGARYWCRFVGKSLGIIDRVQESVWILEDVTEKEERDIQIRTSQKLEAIGLLASGMAHEINTPMQFVGDSVMFVRDAFDEFCPVLEAYAKLKGEVLAGRSGLPEARAVVEAEKDADIEFIRSNIKGAMERASEGVERVAEIVRSMREFAHPGQKEMASADLNKIVGTVLLISKNIHKYVADVETDLGEIPPVVCNAGEINEVLLNLVVNAAQAIEEQVKGSGQKGLIKVRTRLEGDEVAIDVSDTGGGIPESIWEKIYDPFFTTKEVGKGTGQGLSITRLVVVERHKGKLSFDVARGVGTTFHIRLPVRGPASNALGTAA